MAENVPLVTCITLHNIENQQLAIESWLRLGFSVFSLNAQFDINTLKPRFASVEFIAIQDVQETEPGRSPVTFADAAGFLDTRAVSICGLIRSDIHLSATPASFRFLLEAARGSLVFASCSNVDSLTAAAGEICKSGFDFFLFDSAILKLLPATDLCLARPWWDLWLPYCLVRQPGRFPLKFISYPFASRVITTSSCEGVSGFEHYGLLFANFLDQRAHAALLTQPPEMLRTALEAMGLNVAMAILFESQWLSRFPE